MKPIQAPLVISLAASVLFMSGCGGGSGSGDSFVNRLPENIDKMAVSQDDLTGLWMVQTYATYNEVNDSGTSFNDIAESVEVFQIRKGLQEKQYIKSDCSGDGEFSTTLTYNESEGTLTEIGGDNLVIKVGSQTQLSWVVEEHTTDEDYTSTSYDDSTAYKIRDDIDSPIGSITAGSEEINIACMQLSWIRSTNRGRTEDGIPGTATGSTTYFDFSSLDTSFSIRGLEQKIKINIQGQPVIEESESSSRIYWPDQQINQYLDQNLLDVSQLTGVDFQYSNDFSYTESATNAKYDFQISMDVLNKSAAAQ